MDKYLISLDLDETLLNKKSKIPLLTKIGLKSLLQNGHYIILNSGRPFQGMLKYVKELNLYNYPFIASNGGAIYYINHQEEIVKYVSFDIDHEIINDFFTEIQTYLIYAYLQGVTDTYFYNDDKIPFYMKHPHKNVTFFNINQFRINQNIILASFSIKAEFFNKFEKIISKSRYKNISFYKWIHNDKEVAYDMQLSTTNKGLAMMYLARKLKVKAKNTIAFGDQLNDIPMLQIANKGLLMPNSNILEKKYNFPVIPKDHNHSGVIRYLFKNYRELF